MQAYLCYFLQVRSISQFNSINDVMVASSATQRTKKGGTSSHQGTYRRTTCPILGVDIASPQKRHQDSRLKDTRPNQARRGCGEERFHEHSLSEAECCLGITTMDSAVKSRAGKESHHAGQRRGGGTLMWDTEGQSPCLRKTIHRF